MTGTGIIWHLLGETLKTCTGDISVVVAQPPSAGKELNGGIRSRRAGRPGMEQGYGMKQAEVDKKL